MRELRRVFYAFILLFALSEVCNVITSIAILRGH